MLLIVLFLVSLSLISCDPIPLPSPSQQIIIEQPSGHVTTIPLDIPTQLSRGEKLTMETPGFRIGDINEPIEIIPPPIGNWVETEPTIQTTNNTTTNTIMTNTTMTNTTMTNTTSTDEGVIANNPWSAMTSINMTSETNTTTTTTTTSPTWVDVQSERETRYARGAPRPAGFPRAPNMTTTLGTSFNMTIHGNLTSFNLTAHNMTSNHTRVGGGMDSWSFLPGGTESYITGNLTGSRINMTVIAPNTTISIISNSNGTTTISTNTSIPTTTPTPTQPPSKPSDSNTTTPSSAMVDACLSWSLMVSIMLSSVVVC